MTSQRKTIGLALGSGGVKGIAHVGVLKTLIANDIPIDYISGTSIGAVAAAHFALFQDINSLEEIMIGERRQKLISFFEPSLHGGLIGGKKVEALLHKWINDAEFKDAKIPLRIVSTDLVSGEQIVFSQGKIVPAVRASMAVPTVFSPFVFGDKILVDGGLSNPVPDDILRTMGADIVISVNLDNYQRNGIESGEKLSLISTTRRSLDIMRYNLARYSNAHSDIIIKPVIPTSGQKGWLKYFTTKIGPQIMAIGEEEAKKALPQITELIK